MSGPTRERRAALLVAACTAAALLLHFGAAVLPGRFIADRTPGCDTYLLATIYERSAGQVASGHLPLWFPEFGGGYPVHAAWMYGLAYPPHLLFAALPAGTAWIVLAVAHAAFGAAGMYRFLRDEEHDAAPAAAGAFAFAISGFMVGRVSGGHLNLIQPFAWTPWVLLFTGRTVRGVPRAGAWLGLAAGIGLLAGHAQVWFYAGPLALAFAVAEMRRVDSFRAPALRLLAAGAIAAGVSAVQWMPTLALVGVTGTLAPAERTLALGSATLRDLAAAVWPRGLADATSPMRHEMTGVAGPLAALGVLAAVILPGRHKWLFACAVAAGLVLASGEHDSVGRVLNTLPPFSLGRVPARALLAVVIGAGPLTAISVGTLVRFVPAARLVAPAAFVVSGLASLVPDAAVRSDFYDRDWSRAFPADAGVHRIHVADARYPILERAGFRTLRDVCPATPPGWRRLASLSEEPTVFWFDVRGEISVPWRDEPPADARATEVLAASARVRTFDAPGRGAIFEPSPPPEGDADLATRLERGERVLAIHADGAGDDVVAWARLTPARAREAPSGSPSEIAFDVPAGAAGHLFVSETWFPGWEWSGEGGAWEPALRANLTFLAVPLRGARTIRLRYRPSWCVPAAVLCAAATIAAAVLLIRRSAPRSV